MDKPDIVITKNFLKSKPQAKEFLRRWVPQGARDLCNRLLGCAIVYRGIYERWSQATEAAQGYGDNHLFELIESAALAVKRGEAVWEQDGDLFDHIPQSFPVATCLARVALTRNGQLSILDFGGALGGTYRQMLAMLPEIKDLAWHVVEQPHFVASGNRHFTTPQLKFYDTIEECLNQAQPDVVILSSVLQYLEEPYTLLERLATLPIEYLLIDRHPCSDTEELITVQIVPPSLYPASYPSWLFDCKRMRQALEKHYECLLEWDGMDPPIRGKGFCAHFRGSFWRNRALS